MNNNNIINSVFSEHVNNMEDNMSMLQQLAWYVWESFTVWAHLNRINMTAEERRIAYAYLDEMNEKVTYFGYPLDRWAVIFEHEINRYYNQKGLL